MSVFYYIVLLFVAMPVLELTLLKLLWDATSLPFTITLVLCTGVLGAWLARMQGLSAWRKIHQAMASGRAPGQELIDGVMILLAGAVLITPGMITDCVGFALLVPQVRRAIGRRAVATFKKRTVAQFTMHTGSDDPPDVESGPTVIDADFTRVD